MKYITKLIKYFIIAFISYFIFKYTLNQLSDKFTKNEISEMTFNFKEGMYDFKESLYILNELRKNGTLTKILKCSDFKKKSKKEENITLVGKYEDENSADKIKPFCGQNLIISFVKKIDISNPIFQTLDFDFKYGDIKNPFNIPLLNLAIKDLKLGSSGLFAIKNGKKREVYYITLKDIKNEKFLMPEYVFIDNLKEDFSEKIECYNIISINYKIYDINRNLLWESKSPIKINVGKKDFNLALEHVILQHRNGDKLKAFLTKKDLLNFDERFMPKGFLSKNEILIFEITIEDVLK